MARSGEVDPYRDEDHRTRGEYLAEVRQEIDRLETRLEYVRQEEARIVGEMAVRPYCPDPDIIRLLDHEFVPRENRV